MADKKSPPSTLNAIVAFALIGGLLLWLALVLTSSGEKKLEQACKPVEYTTQFLHEVTTAIIGRQPTWTLYTQRYLMQGCYYSFSVLFKEGAQLPGQEPETFGGAQAPTENAGGGIQQ